jgi:hypothetical protein
MQRTDNREIECDEIVGLEAALRSKTKPNAHEWRAAYEHGLEASGYTGAVVGIAHYNQGVMTKWCPLKEDKTTQK